MSATTPSDLSPYVSGTFYTLQGGEGHPEQLHCKGEGHMVKNKLSQFVSVVCRATRLAVGSPKSPVEDDEGGR